VTMAGLPWIIGAMLIGGAIGLYAAKTVQMTQMPELVALMHSIPGAIAEELPERVQLVSLAQRFNPEQIQLLYQITLLGRRDLSLAPDEFAGFTMCLLRMLAFAPQERLAGDIVATSSEVSSRVIPPISPAEAMTDTAAPISPSRSAPSPVLIPTSPPLRRHDDLAEKIQAIQQVRVGVEQTVATQPVFDGDWRVLTEKLKLGGMVKMLAQHCEVAGYDEFGMRISIPPEHKHLLTAANQEKLKNALRDYYGKTFLISFEIGGNGDNTPARQLSQEKVSRQTHAEEAIRSDKFVIDLLDTFGAQIIPSSIKPIQ